MYAKKPHVTNSFEGGQDTDTSDALIAPNRARYMFNVRPHTNGEKGVITNIKGNILITTPLPDGENDAHGWGSDEESNRFIFAVYNSNGFHTFFIYDGLKNTIVRLLQNKTDSNGLDILKFNKDFLINHLNIIGNDKVYFCDGYNKAGKFNIVKALDKSAAGYGLIIEEDFIRAYKKTAIYAPKVTYVTDLTRNSNFLYGKQFKFSVRPIYDDGEKGDWSDYSNVPLPPNQSFTGFDTITYANNCIEVSFNSGSQLVDKIEVAMQTELLPWVIVSVLDKATLAIGDNSEYVFKFYNDGADVATSQEKIIRQNTSLPDRPFCQEYVKNALVYSKFFEGFDPVNIDIEVGVRYQDLYLPDGTETVQNSPAFITTLITNGYQSGSLGIIGHRQNVQQRFQIGFDVKKGNIFELWGVRANAETGFHFVYKATALDNASTVANQFKSYLRSIFRGVPDAGNGISAETIDGSGNVFFDYTILGFWNEGPVRWFTDVSSINFNVLKDDGLSLQLIKPGSVRKYAIAYEDDDGRKGNANTSDKAVVNTGFITEIGDLKQGVHDIKIYNKPPEWARYYYLLRTPDSGTFIQLLVQKVTEINPDESAAVVNDQKYIDLSVGSLFTYQKLKPNTTLVYEFKRGDRLRLIKYFDQDADNTEVFYPYFETEVLSYKDVVVTDINANIRATIGGASNVVTPSDGPKEAYVGQNIVVQDNERTIIGIAAGDYLLDQPLTLAQAASAEFYYVASYKIVDRRGTIRIKRPKDIEIKDLTVIELYKPQENSVNGYKEFFPFGVKLEILNYGTPNRAHAGTVKNQYSDSPNSPAIITTLDGDAYSRNRELPTSNSVPGTQFIISNIVDPAFSDYYKSDMRNLGRVFPQDDGSGRKWFGSRIRYSNNFIQDTRINGLNDFDNLDREDYNDPYGDIQLLRFISDRLFAFKYLITAWIPVLNSILVDNSGQKLVGTSSKLLNQMQYYSRQGGIGDNPESYFNNGSYQYYASANAGEFIRVAGDGCDPISTIFNFDKRAREILGYVAKYKLRIFGGFDKENSDAVWYVPAFNNYLFNGGFIAPEWNTYNDVLPEGATVAIIQQPANSVVSINGDNLFELVAGNIVGDDFFTYQITLPIEGVQPVRKYCFSVAEPVNPPLGWRGKSSTKYCLQVNIGWRGKEGTKYCIKDPALTIISHLADQGDPLPYSDAGIVIKNAGVEVTYQTGNGTETHVVKAGELLSFEGFSQLPSTGSNPTKTMRIERDGVPIYGPETNSNNPGDPSLYYEEIGVAHSTYEAWESAAADEPIDPVSCGIPTPYSGGPIFPFDTIIDLGSGLGDVTLTFDAFGIPDKFEVYFDGVKVIDTGYRGDIIHQTDLDAALAAMTPPLPPETITSPASGTETFEKLTASRYATVRVFAPLPGTGWEFTLGCPV